MRRAVQLITVLGAMVLVMSACAQWVYTKTEQVWVNGVNYVIGYGEYRPMNARDPSDYIDAGWFMIRGGYAADSYSFEIMNPVPCGDAKTREECIQYLWELGESDPQRSTEAPVAPEPVPRTTGAHD
jgi:hypothetical protein